MILALDPAVKPRDDGGQALNKDKLRDDGGQFMKKDKPRDDSDQELKKYAL